MSKKEKKKKSRFGAFMGGSFFGFLLGIGAVVGLVCLVYFKVTPNWINKTFKTEINIGEKANDKSISDFVNTIIHISENKDTYKLSDFKKEWGFGISNQMFGIDISDLKDVTISDLGKAIENKFGTISADELRNVNGMNLESEMGKILNKTNTYYYHNHKLYKNVEHTTQVYFDYTISEDESTVTTKGHETAIVGGVVKIELWYLPLTVALGDFTAHMGDNITLYDLEQSYGVKLPEFFNLTEQEKKDTTVNELDSAINGLKVKDILKLNIKYIETDKVYYNDKDDDDVKDSGEEVSYVLVAIADKKIDELSSTINDFTLSQVFSESERNSGILSLITTDPKISEIPSAIQNIISKTNIQTLQYKNIIKLSTEDAAKLSIMVDHDKDNSTEKVAVGSLTIDELLNYCFDLIPNV